MTVQDPKSQEERRLVDDWVRAERDACFEACGYGRFLKRSFQSVDPESRLHHAIAEVKNHLDASQEHNRLFLESLNVTDGNIPGYHGVLNRALRLVQIADRRTHGTCDEKIVLTTLPTNQRYAAIYEPVVAPGWKVIALDWGMISAIVGLSVCFADCAGTNVNTQGHVTVDFAPAQMFERVNARRGIADKAADFLLPAILANNAPPLPLQFSGLREQMVIGSMTLNALLFCLVAHEYGHVSRHHLSENGFDQTRRFQIEHEADGMALLFALQNPWSEMLADDEEQLPIFSAGSLALLLCFLGMLEMGDRMTADLGLRKSPIAATHPPPPRRLYAIGQLLNQHLQVDKRVVAQVNRFQEGFVAFGEALWNTSRATVFERLSRGTVPLQPLPATTLSGARLMFF